MEITSLGIEQAMEMAASATLLAMTCHYIGELHDADVISDDELESICEIITKVETRLQNSLPEAVDEALNS